MLGGQEYNNKNNRELRQVQNINSRVDNRRRVKQLQKVGENIAKMPVDTLKSEITENEDDGLRGQGEVLKTLHPVSDVMGDLTDISRRHEVLKVAEEARKKAIIGDRFYKAEGFDINNITKGDMDAFRALKKDPMLSEDKFNALRKSSTERVDLNKAVRKDMLSLKRAVAINVYEQNLSEFAKAHPQKFSPEQLKVIITENEIFNYKHLELNKSINAAYIRGMAEVGAFREMKINGMKTNEIEDILFRKNSANALKQSINIWKPDGTEFEVAMLNAYELASVGEAMKSIGKGGAKRTDLIDFVVGNKLRNSDIGQDFKILGTGIKAGQVVVKAGVSASKAAYNTGKIVGHGITRELDKAGAKAVADQMKKFGKSVNEVEEGIKEIKSVPKRILNKGVDKLKKTKTMQGLRKVKNDVINSSFGRTVGKIGKKVKAVGEAAMAPFRFIGKILDIVKKKILIPVAIGIGIIFLVLILLSSLAGIGGSSSSVTFLILDTEEHFKDFQAKYDSCDEAFISQVDSITEGYAQTTNKKGQKIKYGVNGALNSEGNVNEDYKNGITLNYFIDGAPSEGISSNIEDCLSVLTVIMQQQQSNYHQEALELLEALYKSSHTYNYLESPLYGCESGCETTKYFCNEIKSDEGVTYWSTDMKFSPWLYEELYKPTTEQECVICRKDSEKKYVDYAGCTVVGTCYHGEDGDMGRTKDSDCDNYSAVYECDHDCDNEDCSHDCSDSDIGCAGYWECDGHNHYGCPDGHEAKTCFGHVDITMNVNIASMDRLLEMGEVKEK